MMYGNSSMGFSYSPNRSYDVDRFNPSTRSNYTPTYASGSRQGGYYHSPSYCASKPTTAGWYDGAGRYHER